MKIKRKQVQGAGVWPWRSSKERKPEKKNKGAQQTKEYAHRQRFWCLRKKKNQSGHRDEIVMEKRNRA